jgi:hypothetical protein
MNYFSIINLKPTLTKISIMIEAKLFFLSMKIQFHEKPYE